MRFKGTHFNANILGDDFMTYYTVHTKENTTH